MKTLKEEKDKNWSNRPTGELNIQDPNPFENIHYDTQGGWGGYSRPPDHAWLYSLLKCRALAITANASRTLRNTYFLRVISLAFVLWRTKCKAGVNSLRYIICPKWIGTEW